ncbi:hypothetical protein H4R35_003561 [Dimargaris xerosporica]|nr:hypothetical protein H4R35_003561 [Dimargaris xerosporica]
MSQYTVDGELCPAVTKRNLECPPLCVRSLTDCPESASISCPTGEQLCGDGQCHASCGTVVNVCTCNGGSDLEIALVACPVFAPVDVANFNPSNKSAQITAQCSQEFDVNTVDYAMDWASFSTDYRGAWRNCPTDIPDPWYTYTEPMWVGTFAAAGAELLILLSWWLCRKMRQLYRAKASPTLFMAPRGKDDGSATSSDCDGDIKLVGKPEPTSRMSQASMSLESLDAVETPELEFNVQGYCNHWYGTMVLATLVPVSLGFVVFLAIITADYYGSLNDVAISLSYGSTRLSNHTLIMVWYSATVWFLTLNVTRFRLRNAFRMPCAHAQSHVVQIEQALEPMVMLDSESRSLRWLRRLEERVKRFAGWHVVVRTERVHRTQQDRLYFTYQCTRYVLNEATDRFEPFDLCLGDTSQKVLAHEKGLATSEAKRRLELIGPNFISVHVPNFFVALGQEFTSFFYLYQLLILWLFYYNMYYKM